MRGGFKITGKSPIIIVLLLLFYGLSFGQDRQVIKVIKNVDAKLTELDVYIGYGAVGEEYSQLAHLIEHCTVGTMAARFKGSNRAGILGISARVDRFFTVYSIAFDSSYEGEHLSAAYTFIESIYAPCNLSEIKSHRSSIRSELVMKGRLTYGLESSSLDEEALFSPVKQNKSCIEGGGKLDCLAAINRDKYKFYKKSNTQVFVVGSSKYLSSAVNSYYENVKFAPMGRGLPLVVKSPVDYFLKTDKKWIDSLHVVLSFDQPFGLRNKSKVDYALSSEHSGGLLNVLRNKEWIIGGRLSDLSVECQVADCITFGFKLTAKGKKNDRAIVLAIREYVASIGSARHWREVTSQSRDASVVGLFLDLKQTPELSFSKVLGQAKISFVRSYAKPKSSGFISLDVVPYSGDDAVLDQRIKPHLGGCEVKMVRGKTTFCRISQKTDFLVEMELGARLNGHAGWYLKKLLMKKFEREKDGLKIRGIDVDSRVVSVEASCQAEVPISRCYTALLTLVYDVYASKENTGELEPLVREDIWFFQELMEDESAFSKMNRALPFMLTGSTLSILDSEALPMLNPDVVALNRSFSLVKYPQSIKIYVNRFDGAEKFSDLAKVRSRSELAAFETDKGKWRGFAAAKLDRHGFSQFRYDPGIEGYYTGLYLENSKCENAGVEIQQYVKEISLKFGLAAKDNVERVAYISHVSCETNGDHSGLYFSLYDAEANHLKHKKLIISFLFGNNFDEGLMCAVFSCKELDGELALVVDEGVWVVNPLSQNKYQK